MSEENITPESGQPETATGQESKQPEKQPAPDALEALLPTLDDEVKLALLNEGGKKALLAEREAAKAARKERDAALAQVQEYERAKLSEQERLAADLTAAQDRFKAVQQRAVRSEVKALASADFADPEDAHAFLSLDSYVTDDGDVDTDAIQRDLKSLLERKPHLAKPADTSPRSPRPDHTQGSSGNGNRSTSEPSAVFADFMKGALTRGR